VAPDSRECPECGIVFARWQDRVLQRWILPPERDRPVLSRQNRTGLRVLVWTGILIAVVGGIRGISRLSAARRGGVEAQPASVAAAEPEAIREEVVSSGFDVASGLSRLEGILAQIRSEADAYRIPVSVNDVRHHFEQGARLLHPGASRYHGERMGLPSPEWQRFSEEDRAGVRGAGMVVTVRCLEHGRWVYTDRMRPKSDVIGECWQRAHGSRQQSTGTMTIHYGNGWLDGWEHRVWQTRNRRWAPYSEHDELRIMQYVIDTEYGGDAAQRDRDQSRKELERALLNVSLKEPYRTSHIKQAILTAYRTRIEREGARYRLEYERER
jgi:hypothetical protein